MTQILCAVGVVLFLGVVLAAFHAEPKQDKKRPEVIGIKDQVNQK